MGVSEGIFREISEVIPGGISEEIIGWYQKKTRKISEEMSEKFSEEIFWEISE